MSEILPPQTLARIDGAATDAEKAQAMIAGATAPEVLSFDPRSPHYDPIWCRRVRAVYLNGVAQTDVVAFDLPRGTVEVLLRDERGRERHEYLGELWDPRRDAWPTGRLAYKTETREGTTRQHTGPDGRTLCGCGRLSHVSVQYGIPIQTDVRRGGERRRHSDRRSE